MIDTYLNQECTIQNKSGFDKYGKPTLGTARTISCRFRFKQNLFKDENGKEYLTDVELWVLPETSIKLDDVINYEGFKYAVAKLDLPRDLGGDIDHQKAFLRKTK